MKKIISFIPLRSGSKGIPNKNIKPIAGKPLVYWTLNALTKSEVDKIVIATDSEKYIDVVNKYFHDDRIHFYLRDKENAQDSSTTESVILEYLDKYNDILQKGDLFLLVQATNPFITSEDIKKIISDFMDSAHDYDSMLSVSMLGDKFIWSSLKQKYGMDYGLPVNYDHRERPRRQEFDNTYYIENGAMYLSTINSILKHQNRLGDKVGLYPMPSYTLQELDEVEDWNIVEFLLLKHKIKDVFSNGNSLKNVKLFVCDVDGTLTDGNIYIGKNDDFVQFSKKDGKGFQILKELGIKSFWITSESKNLYPFTQRAERLQIDKVLTGSENKLEQVKNYCSTNNIDFYKEVVYIGDDINCKGVLSEVKYPFCPSDAEDEIKAIPNIYICDRKGGEGAVREVINLIKKAHE